MQTNGANVAHFRFYAELNDFLPKQRKQHSFPYKFSGKPAIKDSIEAIGVPHTEVDLIIVAGESVGFDYHLRDGDNVSVYPVFEGVDISPVNRLRQEPLRNTKFVLDVHLGKLARYLRMLGFDAFYRNDYNDTQIVEISVADNRIILTRDQGLLKNAAVTHGYWLRSTQPRKQVCEVLQRFDLHAQIRPFHRCMLCNGKIETVRREDVQHQLSQETLQYFDEFYRCRACGHVYWRGSHFEKMSRFVSEMMASAKEQYQ